MAKVFLGTDTVLGRTVAVKVLAPQFADDDGFVQRFRREAQAAASIGHPNIVSVFDTGSDDGVHFIVMEYVEGRTLAEILAGGGRILPDRAIDIAMDVCRALEAAHAQGVIHRDIKPGNIMLNPRGEVKVTDFGIARVTTTADTVAQTAAILGTASYLSPEQAQGQPGRRAFGHLLARVRAVRDGHGPAAVPRRLARRGRLQAGARAADAAVAAEPGRHGRPRRRDPAGAREEPGEPLPVGRGDARRPRARQARAAGAGDAAARRRDDPGPGPPARAPDRGASAARTRSPARTGCRSSSRSC